MLYSRPGLPQLRLDLDKASVWGGGSCPTQFKGMTTDGKPFYIRYRGGTLSIELGDSAYTAFENFRTLLEQDIGPPLHGDILLDQVCELTGTTLNGKAAAPPSPLECREAGSLDFSGQTVHLEVHGRATSQPAPSRRRNRPPRAIRPCREDARRPGSRVWFNLSRRP